MASRELHNSIVPELVFNQTDITAAQTITSSGFDTIRFESIEFLINWFVADDTSVNADTTIIKIQDSDDNSIFSDVDSEFILGNPLETGIPVQANMYKIGYVGNKQFVRLVITAPTGTNDYFVSSFLVQAVPLNAPTPESP